MPHSTTERIKTKPGLNISYQAQRLALNKLNKYTEIVKNIITLFTPRETCFEQARYFCEKSI